MPGQTLLMSVVPLRPRTSADTAIKRLARRRDVTIELQLAIDGLRSLRSDLEAYYWDRPRDSPEEQRFQVSHWIRQLSDRDSALEGIVLHKGASRLLLPNVTAALAKQLQQAMIAVERPV